MCPKDTSRLPIPTKQSLEAEEVSLWTQTEWSKLECHFTQPPKGQRVCSVNCGSLSFH